MSKEIHPHSSILEALSSESQHATPFSRLPGFVKRFALTKDQEERIVSILSSLGEKELQHLSTRVEHIQDEKHVFNPELYDKIIQIEGANDSEGKSIQQKLIGLAKEIIASEMGMPVYQILKQVQPEIGTGIIDPSVFKNPYKDASESFTEDEKTFIQQEQKVRILMNALIMGAGHRIFDKVETDKKYPQTINKIHPDLYQSYYDMVYTNLKYMWETKPTTPSGANTGSVQLVSENKQTKIKVQADIFPVLLHEMAKGIVEYIAYTRYNTLRPEVIQSILSVDSRESEHWMMLLGPQIYKQLFFLIKEAIVQYDEKKGLLSYKQESDYIVPILSHVVQLPAEQFLSFMETILRHDQDGNASISMITGIIDTIHTQYDAYLVSNNTPKKELTIKDIIKQLNRELVLGDECQNFIITALPKTQSLLEAEGYTLSDKKVAKKLAEHFQEYVKKYGFSGSISDSWLTQLHDTLSGFKKARIEQAAFGQVREQQKKFPKWTKNHEGKSINIHPRFPNDVLEEAKKNVNPDILEHIDNQIRELIYKGSIDDWFKDHDDMSTLLSQLNAKFITLDSVTPECLMEWEGDRGLYELTTIEQLKRESGAMGAHCVADFFPSVQRGSLKVFSLRLGTQSRWTIGYEPNSQTINQIKGYTNKVKNATLTKDDPDYQAVFDALQFLVSSQTVRQINDIDNAGIVFTNQGLFTHNTFIEYVSKNEDPSFIESINGSSLYVFNRVTISIPDKIDDDTLKKLSLIHNVYLDFQIGKIVLQYSLNNIVHTSTEQFSLSGSQYPKIIEKLKHLCECLHVKSIQKLDPIFTIGGMVLTNVGLLTSEEFVQKLEEKDADIASLKVLNGKSKISFKGDIDANLLKILYDSYKDVIYIECDYGDYTITSHFDFKGVVLEFVKTMDAKLSPPIDKIVSSLKYLCSNLPVYKIKSSLDIFLERSMILTDEGLLTGDEFIHVIETGGALRIFSENPFVVLKNDIDDELFKKLSLIKNLKLVFNIRKPQEKDSAYMSGEYKIQYYNNKIEVNSSGRNFNFSDPLVIQVVEKLKYICLHTQVNDIEGISPIFHKLGMVITDMGLLTPQELMDSFKEGKEITSRMSVQNDCIIQIPEDIETEILKKMSGIANVYLIFPVGDREIFYTTSEGKISMRTRNSYEKDGIVFRSYDPLLKKLRELTKKINVKEISGIKSINNGSYVYCNKGILPAKQFEKLLKNAGPDDVIHVLNSNSTIKLSGLDQIKRIPLQNVSFLSFDIGSYEILLDIEEREVKITSLYSFSRDNCIIEITYSEFPRIKDLLTTLIKWKNDIRIHDLDNIYEHGKFIRTNIGILSSQEFIFVVDQENLSIHNDSKFIDVPENTDISIILKILDNFGHKQCRFTKGSITILYHAGTVQKIIYKDGKDISQDIYLYPDAIEDIKYWLHNIKVYHLPSPSYFIKTNDGWIEPKEVVTNIEQKNKISLPEKHDNMHVSLDMDASLLLKLREVASNFLFSIGEKDPFIIKYDIKNQTISEIVPSSTTPAWGIHTPLFEEVLHAVVAITKKVPVKEITYQIWKYLKQKGLVLTNKGILSGDYYLQLLQNKKPYSSSLNDKEKLDYFFHEGCDTYLLGMGSLLSPNAKTPENIVNKICGLNSVELDLTHIPKEIKDKLTDIKGSLSDYSKSVIYSNLRKINGHCTIPYATTISIPELESIGGEFFHVPFPHIKKLDIHGLKYIDENGKTIHYSGPQTTKDLSHIFKKIDGIDNEFFTVPKTSSNNNHESNIQEEPDVEIVDDDLPF